MGAMFSHYCAVIPVGLALVHLQMNQSQFIEASENREVLFIWRGIYENKNSISYELGF